MVSEWFETTIGDQVKLQRGFDITRKNQLPGVVPVVSSGGISSFHDSAMATGPGVVLGRKGSLGTVFFLRDDYWPHDTTLWVKEFKGNLPHYVYYFFKNLDVMHLDVGSANPTLNRNHVHPIATIWPPLAEQRRIAAVLGALDDKIELNRKMNRTLEDMAQAIFKSWFIDFDGVPPSDLVDSDIGPIPRGWTVKTVAEVAELNPSVWNAKTAPEIVQYMDLGNVKWGVFGEYTEYSYQDAPSRARRRLAHGDTIIGTVRPANGSHGLILDPPAFATGSTGFALLRPRRAEATFFLYLWLTRSDFISYLAGVADGSAYPAVSPDIIYSAAMVVPPPEQMSAFHEAVKPLMMRRQKAGTESRTLTELRDTLLPKLISGEIRVPEAEDIVSKVI